MGPTQERKEDTQGCKERRVVERRKREGCREEARKDTTKKNTKIDRPKEGRNVYSKTTNKV